MPADMFFERCQEIGAVLARQDEPAFEGFFHKEIASEYGIHFRTVDGNDGIGYQPDPVDQFIFGRTLRKSGCHDKANLMQLSRRFN